MDPELLEEKAELVALCSLPGANARRISEMLTIFGSPAAAWEAVCDGAARHTPGRPDSTLSCWQDATLAVDPHLALEAVEGEGIEVVVRGEEGYPPLLAETHAPPWALFYRGSLPAAGVVCVAVVGARKATPYGREAARWLAGELAASGVTVVSGAAYGIDHAAHVGALNMEGRTVAVLGCGVDVAYPRSSSQVLDRAAAAGCVLSEYPPGTQPAKYRFPERNRIIAGMSRAVVVVEAAEDSGALLTADCALAEGRDVMAIPGQVFSASSRGTNALIKNGALIITEPGDVLLEIGLQQGGPAHPWAGGAPDVPGGSAESRLIRALKSGYTDAEELSRQTGASDGETLSLLARLEVGGVVIRGPGGRYHLVAPGRKAVD